MTTSSKVERCWWAGSDPLMVAYHDEEWGTPLENEGRLFEMLVLEGFQAGLSWQTILRKRENFRAAFRRFEPAVVAGFDDDDLARLLSDAGIVRNRAKIEAAISNASGFLKLVRQEGSFLSYLHSQVPQPAARLPPDATAADVPATTAVSDALSRDLRRRGFRFVGSTIVYSFMQAVGLVDDHLPRCFRYGG